MEDEELDLLVKDIASILGEDVTFGAINRTARAFMDKAADSGEPLATAAEFNAALQNRTPPTRAPALTGGADLGS